MMVVPCDHDPNWLTFSGWLNHQPGVSVSLVTWSDFPGALTSLTVHDIACPHRLQMQQGGGTRRASRRVPQPDWKMAVPSHSTMCPYFLQIGSQSQPATYCRYASGGVSPSGPWYELVYLAEGCFFLPPFCIFWISVALLRCFSAFPCLFCFFASLVFCLCLKPEKTGRNNVHTHTHTHI